MQSENLHNQHHVCRVSQGWYFLNGRLMYLSAAPNCTTCRVSQGWYFVNGRLMYLSAAPDCTACFTGLVLLLVCCTCLLHLTALHVSQGWYF